MNDTEVQQRKDKIESSFFSYWSDRRLDKKPDDHEAWLEFVLWRDAERERDLAEAMKVIRKQDETLGYYATPENWELSSGLNENDFREIAALDVERDVRVKYGRDDYGGKRARLCRQETKGFIERMRE